MDTASILNLVNNIVIGLISVTLFLQLFFSLFIFFKPKKYKKAKTKHKYGVIICAHNEETVIENAIKSILEQNYPKELIDIFIVAHNCNDKTAEIARKFERTTVWEYNDLNPKHHKKGYALNYAFKKLLSDYNHEGYFVFDADCLAEKDYVLKLNNAFDNGYHLCQGYRNCINFEKNCVTSTNGIFHLRDCCFNSNARNILHSSSILIGTGILIGRECLEDTNGWNAFSLAEDAEFSVQTLLKGHRAMYVDNAEIYIEHPNKLNVSLQRQARIGKGVFDLFFKYGFKLFYKFITTFRFKYLDSFLTLLASPIALICALWFPAYYIYMPITMIITNNMIGLQDYFILVAKVVGLYIFIPLTIQNIALYLTNYKRLHLNKIWKMIATLFYFPIYNLLCSVAITVGILNPKTKWKPVKHTNKISMEKLILLKKLKTEKD